MDDEHGLVAYKQDADLPFNDAGHERHVKEHAAISNEALVAEVHEVTERVHLDVVSTASVHLIAVSSARLSPGA